VQDGVDRHPGRDTERYGIETALAPRFPDPAARGAAIREQAANWAAKWDANSLIILRRALLGFDTRPDFTRIKATVLYILCRTDALFPPKIAPDVIKALTAAGVEARYFELDSDLGQRRRARQMVAGVARVPGAAGRPAEPIRLAEDPRSGLKSSYRRTWIASAILVKILNRR
jgi:hypothetical protein